MNSAFVNIFSVVVLLSHLVASCIDTPHVGCTDPCDSDLPTPQVWVESPAWNGVIDGDIIMRGAIDTERGSAIRNASVLGQSITSEGPNYSAWSVALDYDLLSQAASGDIEAGEATVILAVTTVDACGDVHRPDCNGNEARLIDEGCLRLRILPEPTEAQPTGSPTPSESDGGEAPTGSATPPAETSTPPAETSTASL